MSTKGFKDCVEDIVSNIPSGKVMTYGQLAVLAGSPRSARVVGGVAHFGDPNLPWHRVVNAKGGLASGYPGGRKAHQKHLEEEGIIFNVTEGESLLDLALYKWSPSYATIDRS